MRRLILIALVPLLTACAGASDEENAAYINSLNQGFQQGLQQQQYYQQLYAPPSPVTCYSYVVRGVTYQRCQ